ncbi:MAG: hypothetical protein M3N32_01580 [Actinomycetota bacterium]|nr:hypothetical protein [Actinomycetota bacterium]
MGDKAPIENVMAVVTTERDPTPEPSAYRGTLTPLAGYEVAPLAVRAL